MNIEDFYAEDERRRASSEVEFGRDWRDGAGVRYELSWVQDTGELYLIGVVNSRERIEEVLVGWPEAMAEAEGIEWMAERLRGAGIVA